MNSKFQFRPEVFHNGTPQGVDQSLESLFHYQGDSLSVVVRELVQNSIDASNRNKKNKTRLNIGVKELNFSEFLNHEQLREEFQACHDSQIKTYKDPSVINICKKAISYLNKEQFISHAMFIEDNGGGLDGTSRLDRNKGTQIICTENITNKSASDNSRSLGSFGVGKLTSYLLTNIRTVFYLNQTNNKTTFLGKTLIPTYYKDDSDNITDLYGEKIFCGHENDDHIIDWSKCDIPTLRDNTLGDGLTTIIPFDQNNYLKFNDLNWVDRAKFTIIQSYFRAFENDNLEITFDDPVQTEDQFILNKKNYQNEFKLLEDKIFKIDDYELQHQYLMVKPIVLEEKPVKEVDLSVKFKLDPITNDNNNKQYKTKGVAKIYFYENNKLEELIETHGLSGDYRFNFRILRDTIFIRNFCLPHVQRSRLKSYKYSGFVEFIDKEGNSLNELIRQLETQSHDDLNLDKLSSNYKNSASIIDKKLIKAINNKIKDVIHELTYKDIKDLKFIDIDLDVSGDSRDSDSSNISKKETYKKKFIDLLENNKSSKVKSQTIIFDEEGKDDGFGFLTPPKPKPPPPYPPGPNPFPGPNPGPNKTSLKDFNKRSKLISKKGDTAKYFMRLTFNNTININKIYIYQMAIDGHKNTIKSFDIKQAMINSTHLIKSDSITKTKNYEAINFNIDNCESLDLELQVKEPFKTINEFYIIIQE